MSKRGKSRAATVVELFFDAFLLLCFLAQAFVFTCLLAYGYLPLPAQWLDQAVSDELPNGVSVQAQGYALAWDGTIRVEGLHLRAQGIEQPIFESDDAHIEFELDWNRDKPLSLKECVFSEGRLSLPAVYSPSGKHSTILEKIALRLVPVEGGFGVDSLAARHEDIRLRGSIDWLWQSGPREPVDVKEGMDLFFKRVGNILEQKSRFNGLSRPTILFHLSSAEDQSLDISTRLISPRYDHDKLKAKNLTLNASLSLEDQSLITDSSILLEADSVELPSSGTRASFISAKVEREEWEALLQGEWPDMEVAAESLEVEGIQLESPRIKLSPQAFPELAFQGFTSGLQGAVRFSGMFNTKTRAANLHAAGSLDLLSIAPETITERLPSIGIDRAPHYILDLRFEEGFSLANADLVARVDALAVEDLDFDHVRFRANYHAGKYSIDRLYLRRDWQWLDLGFHLDSKSKDYALTLVGFAKPDDYNALLPRWWGGIFKEFDFGQVEDGLGDFVIYGNTDKKAADFFFGHARARKVGYKGVPVEEGELFVRGRGPYAEVHRLDVRSGAGFARGDIRFASRLDEVRGPVSVRLDLDTKLPLTEAKKLFDDNIARILSDFETDALPRTKLGGVIFNRAYPEFEGRSHIDITADCAAPVSYRGLPLDFLRFDLMGRETTTYLRNIHLGFAEGEGKAEADIRTGGEAPAQMRFKFSLQEASQEKAVALLSRLRGDEGQAGPSGTGADPGRLDLRLHAQGPVDAPMKMEGAGDFQIEDDDLYAIQLFGPLSKLLQNTRLGFTSFGLNEMEADFTLENGSVHFRQLEINGPRTRIEAPGILQLDDFSLAMRVSVYLFGNAGNPDSRIRRIGEFITRPIPNLLEFELTGTPEDQKWRSLYDPRKFIPLL